MTALAALKLALPYVDRVAGTAPTVMRRIKASMDLRALKDAIVALEAPPDKQMDAPLGYITKDDLQELREERIAGHVFPKGTLRPENEVPVYASPPKRVGEDAG